MLNSLITLKTLHYSSEHPLYVKAKQDFAGLFVDDPQDFRIQPFLSPVWDTAINIISLAESGLWWIGHGGGGPGTHRPRCPPPGRPTF